MFDLCEEKGYCKTNYCYEQCKEWNITKMVVVKNDNNLLCLTRNFDPIQEVNLYMNDGCEWFVEACDKMLLEEADDVGEAKFKSINDINSEYEYTISLESYLEPTKTNLARVGASDSGGKPTYGGMSTST